MSHIYIHIPFCEQKCGYCRFASTGKIQNLHIEKYVNFLCEEIKNKHDNFSKFKNISFNNNENKIETIYFGGGTPGVLSLKQFEKILNIIKSKFNLSKNCEISIESTPDKINLKNLKGWKNLGVNRISIGIQTLNEKSLIEVGRGNKGDILEALDIIKNNNKFIENISIDFIIGLPYVKKGEILDNIKFILNKYGYYDFIKHISVYMLEDYYSPDKIIETKYDKITYPEKWENHGVKEEDFLLEYSNIKKYLLDNGFNNYEISNYSKSGFECKHNIGYWNHREVLGFGLGAYGFINNTRYANSDNFKSYYKGEQIFENKLTPQDLFIEKVMFGLRTNGLKKDIYKKLNEEKINYFIKNGYIEKKSDKIVLKDSGVLIMDYIISGII